MAISASAAETGASDLALNDMGGLYAEHCSSCHGANGDGQTPLSLNPPAKDFSSFKVAAELSRERMVKSVLDGRPGTAMAAWRDRLTAAQIDGVVGYIRANFMPAVTTETVNEGRRVYARHCSVCHGDTGQGALWARSGLDPAPANFTVPSTVAVLNRERMIASVAYGRAQTAMPAWKGRLSDEQIEQTVDFIRYSIMRLPSDALHQAAGHVPAGSLYAQPDNAHETNGEDVLAAPLPYGLVGNVNMGVALYQRNCVVCHGVTGDGNGPRAYFIFPKPRDFRAPEAQAKYSRAHLFDVISKGTLGSEMPAWNKVLTDAEIGHLAEYVFKAYIEKDGAAGSD
ncbi:MAG: c-type cytochrome [Motiliproteus sp.]